MAETPKVKIYTLSTCGHCKMTKKLLNEFNIEYDYVDVDMLGGEDRQSVIDEVKQLNPKCSFPTIKIGEQVIVGHKEDQIKEAIGIS